MNLQWVRSQSPTPLFRYLNSRQTTYMPPVHETLIITYASFKTNMLVTYGPTCNAPSDRYTSAHMYDLSRSPRSLGPGKQSLILPRESCRDGCRRIQVPGRSGIGPRELAFDLQRAVGCVTCSPITITRHPDPTVIVRSTASAKIAGSESDGCNRAMVA